jgi:hypothetical protein
MLVSLLQEFGHYLAIYIFFKYAIAISSSEGLDLVTEGSGARISVCLIPLTSCTFNTY